jgi:hypothetical protein
MLDPADPRFVTGTEQDREAARREWHKQRFLARDLDLGRGRGSPP